MGSGEQHGLGLGINSISKQVCLAERSPPLSAALKSSTFPSFNSEFFKVRPAKRGVGDDSAALSSRALNGTPAPVSNNKRNLFEDRNGGGKHSLHRQKLFLFFKWFFPLCLFSKGFRAPNTVRHVG